MRRWHAEQHIAARKRRAFRALHSQGFQGAAPWRTRWDRLLSQDGYWRKAKANYHHSSKCWMCGSEKYLGRPKRQQRAFEISEKEQRSELF